MLSKKIRGQFPDQSQEKKEEKESGEWVDVSLGFLLVDLWEPNI